MCRHEDVPKACHNLCLPVFALVFLVSWCLGGKSALAFTFDFNSSLVVMRADLCPLDCALNRRA